MGLFGGKEPCCICGGKGKNKVLENEYLCNNCFVDFTIFSSERLKTTSAMQVLADHEGIRKFINFSKKNRELLEKFVETNKINKFISIDENNKFIKISDIRKGGEIIETVYATDEIIEFELLEDEESIVSGGLGRAVVGGALFGATGAVVGGVTGKKTTRKIVNTFKIKITFNNINNPLEYINLINTRTKTNSSIYQNACNEAQEILSVLSIIVKNNDKANNEQDKTSSSIEQVKGLKELLDIGAITEEEFNTKKKELLNL
ncbi:TPA: SHOCT domain-containing protein [Clostridioides difficile]|nr:SHOCT domain-containing protein [Clostridioides difficile]